MLSNARTRSPDDIELKTGYIAARRFVGLAYNSSRNDWSSPQLTPVRALLLTLSAVYHDARTRRVMRACTCVARGAQSLRIMNERKMKS